MQRLSRDLQAVDEIRIFDTLYIRHQSAWSIPCARENDIKMVSTREICFELRTFWCISGIELIFWQITNNSTEMVVTVPTLNLHFDTRWYENISIHLY